MDVNPASFRREEAGEAGIPPQMRHIQFYMQQQYFDISFTSLPTCLVAI